jgi:hypothetical protein
MNENKAENDVIQGNGPFNTRIDMEKFKEMVRKKQDHIRQLTPEEVYTELVGPDFLYKEDIHIITGRTREETARHLLYTYRQGSQKEEKTIDTQPT